MMAGLLFLLVLGAAVAAAFILAIKWAWLEDRKANLKQRFDQVISSWGKEK